MSEQDRIDKELARHEADTVKQQEKISEEKEIRIKYQEIVYAICIFIDQRTGNTKPGHGVIAEKEAILKELTALYKEIKELKRAKDRIIDKAWIHKIVRGSMVDVINSHGKPIDTGDCDSIAKRVTGNIAAEVRKDLGMQPQVTKKYSTPDQGRYTCHRCLRPDVPVGEKCSCR